MDSGYYDTFSNLVEVNELLNAKIVRILVNLLRHV